MSRRRKSGRAPAPPHSAPPDTVATTAGTATDTVPATPPDDGLYWESKVAAALGIARERVGAIRHAHLVTGEHYRLVRNEVVLTETGLAKLNAVISEQDGLPATGETPPPADQPIDPPVPKGPPARARFQVVRVPANKRLLYCVPEGEHGKAPQVLIRCKDNANFMYGMRLEAIEGEGNSWQFRGRLPRKKGRW